MTFNFPRHNLHFIDYDTRQSGKQNYISHNSNQSSKSILDFINFREKNSVGLALSLTTLIARQFQNTKMLKGEQHVDVIISTLPLSKWIDSGKPWPSQIFLVLKWQFPFVITTRFNVKFAKMFASWYWQACLLATLRRR